MAQMDRRLNSLDLQTQSVQLLSRNPEIIKNRTNERLLLHITSSNSVSIMFMPTRESASTPGDFNKKHQEDVEGFHCLTPQRAPNAHTATDQQRV